MNSGDDKGEREVYLLVGLPRSGKSTVAKLLKIPIVSKDAIRLSVHGTSFRAEMESYVHGLCDLMVASLFNAGHKRVLVDECHVSLTSRERWVEIGYTVKLIYAETGLEECIKRAIASGQDYLVPVIKRMNRNFDRPKDVWYKIPLDKEFVAPTTSVKILRW